MSLNCLSKSKIKLALSLLLSLYSYGNMPYAHAQSQDIVYSPSGKPMFEFNFINQGQQLELDTPSGKLTLTPEYTLDTPYRQGLLQSGQYWADILGAGSQNTQATQIVVNTDNKQNASAGSYSFINGQFVVDQNLIKQTLQGGKTLEHVDLSPGSHYLPDGDSAFGIITVGKYMGSERPNSTNGWYLDNDTLIPTGEQAADYVSTMRHELAHYLGIAASVNADGLDADRNALAYFMDIAAGSWASHLIDQNGNAAQSGMEVITTAEFKRRQALSPDLAASDFFIIDNIEQCAANIPTAGKAYFVGKKVSEVLGSATFDGVSGVPISTWTAYHDTDGKFSYNINLSHIQIANGMMSHQGYRNYTTFTEVELAVMQDLGYNIDRKNHYGYSLYDNNQNIANYHGYSARNADGSAYLPNIYNMTSLGIGLHIYGSNNTLTQAADILTAGRGAAGIRIDGVGNNVNIARGVQVRADGYRGVGLLTAYGKNHVINQSGVITADGEGGVGVQFDFGSNMLGVGGVEYRGSYIQFNRYIDENGQIKTAFNPLPVADVAGALVSEYNLSGYLSGRDKAIYIGKNAFVDKINVLDGAHIRGDIVSDWLDFSDPAYSTIVTDSRSPLMVNYENKYQIAYYYYLPKLITQLNFNTDIAYNGKISGHNNMKLNVNKGTLHYSGTADVVAVNVSKGGSLIGGSYIVNFMGKILDRNVSEEISQLSDAEYQELFGNDNTGVFVNHGTIGAATPTADADSVMHIDGRNAGGALGSGHLVSDGNIRFTAYKDKIGYIDITGTADLRGSKLVIDPNGVYIPEHSYSDQIVRNGISSFVDNGFADFESHSTGMMGSSYDNGQITFSIQDNLGSRSQQQATMLALLNRTVHGNSQAAYDFAELYSLQADAAKASLSQLYGGINSSMAEVIKFDTFLADMVSARSTNKNEADRELWAVLQRDWLSVGAQDDQSKLTDQTWRLAVGHEQLLSDKWQLGYLLTYGKHDLSSGGAKGKAHDYRLAIYGLYRQQALSVSTYASAGWHNSSTERNYNQLNRQANSRYLGYTLGLGARAGIDLQYGKLNAWHTIPYLRLDALHYTQNSYSEHGADVYDQTTQGYSGNMLTAGIGVEFVRDLHAKGSYSLALGYQRKLVGFSTPLTTSFSGSTDSFIVYGNTLDRNTLQMKLSANIQANKSLRLQTELQQLLGSRTKNTTLSLQANWSF